MVLCRRYYGARLAGLMSESVKAKGKRTKAEAEATSALPAGASIPAAEEVPTLTSAEDTGRSQQVVKCGPSRASWSRVPDCAHAFLYKQPPPRSPAC